MFALILAASLSAPLIQVHEEKSFVAWMKTNNFLFTGDEYQVRFGIWLANKRSVQEHNADKKSFKVSLNKFAALTSSEYKSLLGYKKLRTPTNVQRIIVKKDADVNWTAKGVVNEIQDQGQCGSCWAFSAIQSIESIYAIAHQTLYKLSEQNLVDCVIEDDGCGGGLMDDAFNYVIKSQKGAVNLLGDCPYTAKDLKIPFAKN
jgi:C1A family cysteine protease